MERIKKDPTEWAMVLYDAMRAQLPEDGTAAEVESVSLVVGIAVFTAAVIRIDPTATETLGEVFASVLESSLNAPPHAGMTLQ
jgi:hypothetical protein